MFEAQVLQLLRQYLGEYVHGLSAEALKISVWQGDVVLKDLQLKAEALNSLKLPVTVKAGFLGSVTLKVPWNRLGKESVVVLLDRIFILAEPIQDEKTSKEKEKEKLLEAKRRRLKEAETALLDAKKKKNNQGENTAETSSWLGSLIATIIGNLKISITNVHIRYEDCTSNPGKPFCCGATLSRLAAVTIDENAKETFVTSGALDKLHKSLQLERFALYHDSDTSPWNIGESWSDMTPKQWCEVFEAGINQKSLQNSTLVGSMKEPDYLLRPVNGVLNYYRRGKREQRDHSIPLQNLSLVLDGVSLTVSETQYCDGLKLLEGVSCYRKRIEFSHFRPWVPVLKNPRTWWVYACQAGLKQQKKTRSHLSWGRVDRMCSLRRTYVQLYLEALQLKSKTENSQIREIEEEVDTEVLLLWRLLARAKAESLKSEESSSQRDKGKGRWWGFRWRPAAADNATSLSEAGSPKQERGLGDFTKEEWGKINELLNYRPGEEASLLSAQETPDSLQILVDATIKESAVQILDKNKAEILCGNFVALSVCLKLYPNTTECLVKLQSYGLSAPEGSLIKSVSGKDDEQALTACYIQNPLNSPLDWKVSATILPCYVTVWFASFERFMQFLKSGHDISPDVTFETATALQIKLGQVRRRAQEQLKLALEEESRFSINLDVDAPKVRLPADLKRDKGSATQLVLDLGHFTLHTDNEAKGTRESNAGQAPRGLYSQFYISGSDIAAYLVDGTFEWEEMQAFLSMETGGAKSGHDPRAYRCSLAVAPVIDRCRMFLLFEKLRIPHPAYPLTHIALQVPHLGLHFSPGRYRKLAQLVATFNDSNGSSDKVEPSEKIQTKASWYPPDHEGSSMVLVWKGLGNAVAEWQPCWAVLSGSYLYILESGNSQTYQRCCSITGKQVLDVPPSNIGGSEFVLAVCNQGMELQKGLESSGSVIMKLADQESKEIWHKVLMSAVFRLSGPVSLSLPEELMDGVDDLDVRPSDFLDQPILFVSGALHKLQLSLYVTEKENSAGLDSEGLLLSLQAGGGQVNVFQRQNDLKVGMNLHYLKIEDRLKGPLGSGCQYIARSIINRNISGFNTWPQDIPANSEINSIEEEDVYNDAVAEFGGSPSSLPGYWMNELAGADKEAVSNIKGNFLALGLEHIKLSAGECLFEKIFSETDGAPKSFVSMLLIMRQFESPDYDGTDVKMSISMATLEFFCNRPTVVALIEFGTEISGIVEQQSEATSKDMLVSESTEVSPESIVVKGLLGQGKTRTVFHLKMSMDSVRIFLNLEDGKQLAMLDQERFHMDLKVFPGSFSINSTLGNLKICDMTLGAGHHWGWMCDIRDPGCDSLVKLEFQSYNVDEEDYQGYDYSLGGRLSSLRIVFLYRFIQEVITYFTALSAPHTQQLTRVVDKVGGIEKLVPQSDIDGSPALKLNVFLETPIIIMPGCSASKDFMQLDLGYLKVSNEFEWHGGLKENDSAIHLDVLSAEVSGINLVVGIDGVEGKSMIQEVQGLRVRVCRPLRDLFKRAPEVQIDVQVQMLRGILSDKEYLVITGCATSNIAEIPHLPPDFRNAALLQPANVVEEISKDSALKKAGSEENKSFSQTSKPWTTVRVTVEVQNAELELHNGLERELALARVELEGLWLNYRSTSIQEMTLLMTLPRLCILDLRSATKPEMRLLLGSMADAESSAISSMSRVEETCSYGPQPPMLVMDAKLKQDSQAFIVRIQRPRLLVVLDFLLSVGEFFVPSLAVKNKEEGMDSCHDPLILQEHLRLVTTYYKQEAAVLTISSSQRLIVDYPDIDLFTYDGCGNTLCLDCADSDVSQSTTAEPIIIIGAGKRLRFKNIKIKNGLRLKDCVQLHSHSSFSVCVEDGVVLDGAAVKSFLDSPSQAAMVSSHTRAGTASSGIVSSSTGAMNFILELQAVGPELTFYDSERDSNPSSQRQEKFLRLKIDLNLMYAYRETDVWLRGSVKRFSLDGGSGLTVIEPMVTSMEYARVKEKTSLNIFASDFSVQLSFSLMRLLIHLYDDLTSTFHYGGDHTLLKCSHFDRIWVNTECTYGQRIAIWKPRAPPGFAVLSHSITSGEAPPSQAVMAIRNIYHRAKKPLSFDLVYVLHDLKFSTLRDTTSKKDMAKGCFIWKPVAPPGYVAVGCVAKIGPTPPPLSAVYCVRSDLVTSASINDCVLYAPSHSDVEKGFSIWRIENAAGSFFAHQSMEPPSRSEVYDLRDIAYDGVSDSRHGFESSEPRNKLKGGPSNLEQRQSMSGPETFGMTAKAGRLIATTAQFERMWWDKGSDNRRIITIWRPVPPPGYAIVGDHITEGPEPPGFGIIVKDDNSGWLTEPIRLVQCMHSPGKGLEQLYVWYPIAPAGFVTLGCIVSRDNDVPSLQTVRCVRADLVNEVTMSKKPIWSVSASKSGYNCSLWKLHNQANTFLARPDLKKPSDRLAYGLLETVQCRMEDNLCAEIKITRFSITVLDDLRGLITPLANVTVTSINLAANGRTESFSGVCVSSMAASTFNAQLESWEPLIEPFEGIFKYESHDSQSGAAFKVGRRIRITSASVVNVNVSSANVDLLLDSLASWKRQCEFEEKATTRMELDKNEVAESSMTHISPALEEDDTEKLVLENKLGCSVFLRTFTHEFKDCQVLEAGNRVRVHVPPTTYVDKLTSEGLKFSYQHVAVHISEAKGLPMNKDGTGQEYFYSLHFGPVKQPIQGQRSSSQSARSRCVRPTSVEQSDNTMLASVAWNEVFLFDLPHQGIPNMDIRVSNQAANSGRGELIGMVSIPLRMESDEETVPGLSHWKLIQQSLRQGYQTSWPLVQEKTYSLQLPGKQTDSKVKEVSINNHGSLVASIYYFTEKVNQQGDTNTDEMQHSEETGLLIGLNSGGPWFTIRSVLALGPVPIHVPNGHMALDVAMHEGKKIATLRSLVILSNDTDNDLEICVCPVSLLNSPDDASLRLDNEPMVEVDEIFENQRYQLLGGWGSKWPGHFLPTDPGHWSSRDNQKSSQAREDLEVILPPGWIWSTDWVIDKAGYVDDNGWAYGPDFQTLRWPPNSMKSCKKSRFDFIRRRRWCRTRERASSCDEVLTRKIISVLQPGENVSIPLGWVLSATDFCLQVRPKMGSTAPTYLWGRAVSASNQSNREYTKGDDQSSSRRSSRLDSGRRPPICMLKDLQKVEGLLMCPPENPSASKTAWWLSMESDANILYNAANSQVYDWRLSVSAPLKLENLLPCDADYTVWERHKEGSPVQRDRGVATAGSTVNIFSVDIRRKVYLTLFVQGGWRLEKDIVLISDPMLEDLPSGFPLINQQNGRRLQVSLERVFGTTNVAARTVRIFVPYWLCNRAALPLSYCLVEVEPAKGSDGDSPWLMRAVKAAKHASSRPSHSQESKTPRIQRVVQRLDVLENTVGIPTMLSLQAQLNKTGFIPFSPRAADDGLMSPRLGISVCASHSNHFKYGISFRDLEDNERTIVKAMDETGAYYKLSVFLSMSSERTKVVNFQPLTLFVNRLGQQLYLRQCDLDCAELLYPNDPPKVLLWQSATVPEMIEVFMDGYEWSSPFSVDSEGILYIILRSGKTSNKMLIKAEIRNGTTGSRYLVIFRHVSFTSPYRLENISLVFPIRIRQSGSSNESWQLLPPGSAVPFSWEDLQREHKLEIIVDGADSSNSRTYAIDECTSYLPVVTEGTAVAAFFVKIVQEGSTKVVKVGDWMPSNKELPIVPYGSTRRMGTQHSQVHDTQQSHRHEIEDQMHVVLELAELGISLVDHTPEEILYLSMQNFTLAYATGLGSGISRFKVRVDGLQLDNELPLTPMPVLFRNQGSINPLDSLFKCTITLQDGQFSNGYVYPYIGVQVPSATNTVFLVNIHEPIIWRVQQMLQRLNLSRLTASQTTDVSVDPIICIGLLNTSEVRFKVSLAMSPTQRPRDALGFWTSLATALGNTDDLQIRIAPRIHEDICMRQSALLNVCMSSIKKDILSHPLLLLSGVDILGNASSALGHMSKGVAALSMDKKFIKSRQKQDTKASVEGFGDGFREGAEALGKGLFRGVTGILTKPLEGAKSSGMEGFMQGVGKGILGVAAQPVSGVLDLLSKTTEGANAVKTKITAVITSEGVLLRRRLPRVIGADKILHPYDEFKAQGQILLQLAESSSLFGPMDIFKVRGKFAMSDVYEDHFNLPKGRTLIITHRRVILLQHPTSIIVQKKPDLMKDPCSVLWDVTWNNLGTMELTPGKHDTPSGGPSRLVLYLQTGAVDVHRIDQKELVRIVKCNPGTNQASQIYAAIQQALSTYGPEQLAFVDRRAQQKNVKRPYSGSVFDPTLYEGPGTSSAMPEIGTFSTLVENSS